MALTLYDISVASYLQTLDAVKGFLARGLSHCSEAGVNPAEIVETRLWPDMNPFRFQIVTVAHQSLGAIDGIKQGVFSPPPPSGALTYADLQQLIAETRDKLAALTPAEVNSLAGRDVTFQVGDFKVPFTAEGFILSFSLPNFYFHATTAYDILRSKGVPLGKRDFLGAMRTKGA